MDIITHSIVAAGTRERGHYGVKFFEQDFPTLKAFEDDVIDIGHIAMAKAMSSALEIFDEKLSRGYVSGLKVKEKRKRSLATRIGDVSFVRRICTDGYGNPVVPLDEALDLPHNARVSPGAVEFLLGAGIEVSYAKPQAISVIGQRFDLSRIEKCHAGFDGEGWCKQGGAYLPAATKTNDNLDAFHVNRSIAACFSRSEADANYQVLDCVWYRRADDAAEMLEYYKSKGITKEGDVVEKVAKYLRNNAEFIHANPPSLGTMEAENEHLYASRMKSVPCAWSVQGVSDMARLHSRKFSGREMLYPTREESLSEEKKRLRQKRIEAHFNKKYSHPVKCIGHSYEYPHKASMMNFRADIRYRAGLTADHKIREGIEEV